MSSSTTPSDARISQRGEQKKSQPVFDRKCQVYICPKCNTKYCTKECYQHHSIQCTERFYQANVEEELKHKKPSISDQKKFNAILQRHKEQQDRDSRKVEQIAKDGTLEDVQKLLSGETAREDELLELAALDLNDPDIESKLSPYQLQQFHVFLQSGELGESLTAWKPWWLRPNLDSSISIVSSKNGDETNKDTEADSLDDSSDSEEFDEIPKILEPIPALASITTASPSPLLANNVIEVLYAYVLVKILFNGDWEDENQFEALDAIISLSAVLSHNTVYDSIENALRSIMEHALMIKELQLTIQFVDSILKHLLAIIAHGSTAIKAALSDMYNLFMNMSIYSDLVDQAIKERQKYLQYSNPSQSNLPPQTSSNSKNSLSPSTSKQNRAVTLSQMQKKLLFFIVWSNEKLPSFLVHLKFSISEFINTMVYSSLNAASSNSNPHNSTQTFIQSELSENKTQISIDANLSPTKKKGPLVEEIN